MKFIVITLLLKLVLFAEPTSPLKFLMNEPVSMLDMGLYRIEKKIDSNPLGYLSNSIVSSKYDYNNNRIIITLEANINSSTRNNCDGVLYILASKVRNSIIDGVFEHNGYQKNIEPKRLSFTIRERSYVRVKLRTHNNTNITCERYIDSDNTLYSK